MPYRLPDVYSKNRSEETREDNWLDFVVPPFFNDLKIKTQTKAIMIVGGRGCGKTTLLRYFCHPTQFSSKIISLRADSLLHIGLYWRADTNFLNSFVGGGQSEATWRSAFQHLLACELGKEIIHSLWNLNCNPARQVQFGQLDKVDLSVLQEFLPSLGSSLAEVEAALQKSRRAISMWLNNLDTHPKPTFLPTDEFLRTLIETLQKQLTYLADSTFAIFIDEYENLRIEQQCFINGLLKHGRAPLLYNIAMKRNGLHTSKTTGPEYIQPIADYNEIDLENEINNDFDLFAAELLFFRLAEHEPHLCCVLPIIPDNLRSVEHVEQRYNDKEYRLRVIAAAEKLLPRTTERSAAKEIIDDSKLRNKLKEKIELILTKRKSDIKAEQFIDEKYPEASVLMPALLSRPRETPHMLLQELSEMRSGAKNRLAADSQLISNNLFGCVNFIFLDARRASILFSGFTALTLMARGNIRHLLELIHRILKAYKALNNEDIEGGLPVVPPKTQAAAVREASESILKTINGSGTYGPQLYALTQCLGSIFRERHRSVRQSEPEINHFTISGGDQDDKLCKYLKEAEKWSVLFLSKETKMKALGSISTDYILNPIFSAYFQISFRKKRSLPLTAVQLRIMLESDQDARDSLVRELGRQDNSDPNHLTLFGDE